jgi:hypothetical protein
MRSCSAPTDDDPLAPSGMEIVAVIQEIDFPVVKARKVV